MRRRDFITLIGGAAAWPLAARAQQTGRVHRVGVLFVGSGPGSVPDAAFRSGLRERGYIEGQNIVVEFRSALGNLDALPGLATELVALNLDVIFAPAEAALRSCLQASRTVPIVIASGDYDPVDSGFVTNLARPGGNVTGVFFRQVETSAKRVELLKETVPRLSRIATLVDPSGRAQLDETERAAKSLGVDFKVIELSLPPDFEKAFETIVNEHVEAIVVLATPITYAHRARIASLATKNRIPAIAPFPEFVDEGGLLSYGASFATLFHYAAYYVDRILRGASPADLPMEQPGRFELSINVKTAKALSLMIPPSLLVGANHLVE